MKVLSDQILIHTSVKLVTCAVNSTWQQHVILIHTSVKLVTIRISTSR